MKFSQLFFKDREMGEKVILYGVSITFFFKSSDILKNLFIWPHHETEWILIPQSGVEAMPPAVKAQSPNHWTTREFPLCHF